jgi:proteasome accessory factor A
MRESFTAPRITGTEMEWSALVQMHKQASEQPLPSQTAEHFFQEHLPPDLSRVRGYCSNGSRLYSDIGEHPEYATPEDASLMGTVANEIAGERILYHILNSAKDKKELHNFVLNKRVVDEYKSGRSWGYHENYLAPADALEISARDLALLGTHLATRNVLVGAGGLRRNGDGNSQYFLAQKATDVTTDFRDATTSNKPVVNLRQEPHADSDIWRRVHVTSGDPNMSPWASFMKLGTTSLVLRLIENGDRLEKFRVHSLASLAQHVASDLTLRQTVRLVNGTTIRPLEIQVALHDAARALAEDIDLPDEEKLVLVEWQRALDDAKSDPRLLQDRSDWVAKKIMLDGYADRHGLHDNDPGLFKKDRQWDNIGPLGIGIKLRKTRWADWMPSDALIADRMFTPPDNTRAAVRGKFIKHFEKSSGITVDWRWLRINNHSIDLSNPYSTTNTLVSRLTHEEQVA